MEDLPSDLKDDVIRFENCYFKYRHDLNPVLKDFSF
jgi:ABC-type bacteriocin/lantibiotic exporter with double-glycine peptidase domain